MSNKTYDSSSSSNVHPTSPESEWYWTIETIIALTNIIINGSVIFAILFKQVLHTAPNWFILSLAIADILMAVLVYPIELFCTFGTCSRWAFKIVRDTVILGSTANLFCIVLDRHFAVVYPLKYQRFSASRKVVVCITISWCFSIFVPVSIFLVKVFVDTKSFKIYRMSFEISWLILLNLSLLIWYTKMLRVVKSKKMQINIQLRQLKHNYPTKILRQFNTETDRNGRSALNLTGALIVLFVCCTWLAFYNDLHNYILSRIVSRSLYVTGHILLPLNSLLNGVVYALLKKDIKRVIVGFYCNLINDF